MSRLAVWVASVLLSVMILLPSASADIIRLKNGSSLQGTVVKRTARQVIVKFDFGTMAFTADEIASIENDAGGPLVQETSVAPATDESVPPARDDSPPVQRKRHSQTSQLSRSKHQPRPPRRPVGQHAP